MWCAKGHQRAYGREERGVWQPGEWIWMQNGGKVIVGEADEDGKIGREKRRTDGKGDKRVQRG